MRVRRGRIRLLEYHLERLFDGCARLADRGTRGAQRCVANSRALRSCAARAVLKLIVTRGVSSPAAIGRPGANDAPAFSRCMPCRRRARAAEQTPVRVRLCATPLGLNPRLAGLKTLNRLESVLARAEWSDARIWEGLMQDMDGNIVCGTMSNLFLRRGSQSADTGARSLRCGRGDAPLGHGNGRQFAASRHRAPHTLAGPARGRGSVHEQRRRRSEIRRGDRTGQGAAAVLRLRHGDSSCGHAWTYCENSMAHRLGRLHAAARLGCRGRLARSCAVSTNRCSLRRRYGSR